MKKFWGSGLVLICLGTIALFLLFFRNSARQNNEQESLPSPVVAVVTKEIPAHDAELAQTNRLRPQSGFILRAADMTEDEKQELANKFQEKFKPAMEKWFGAYEGHIPFRLEDVTLDKFHSRVTGHMYTFMVGDTTFTLQDSNDPDGAAKVSYLMTRKGAKELNQIPKGAFVADLNVPIGTEDIIRMVKADSGVEFKPNEVTIRPTAAACGLNGGAFVDILPTGADPNNFLNTRVSMVFGPDGNLVNYERDPFF